MRITSGILKGRELRVPKSGVRPTQDRLRQSLFSSLGNRLDGWRVLDLFAGTGALGLEAWSRGAAEVCWVERDTRVFAVLRENVESLCRGSPEGAARCLRADALRLEALAATLGSFDLVLADPPYEAATRSLRETLLRDLARFGVCRPGGYFVIETAAGPAAGRAPGWELLRDRESGGSRWRLYRRLSSESPSEGAGKGEDVADGEEQEHQYQESRANGRPAGRADAAAAEGVEHCAGDSAGITGETDSMIPAPQSTSPVP